VKAAIWEQPGELRIGERDDPTPGHGELVVKVGACGLCGTDLHIADGHFEPTPYPLVPGHEFAGEVVAVGPSVDGWAEGARVAVDPSLFCGHCEYCRIGRGNLCANWNAIGDTVDGAFAEYVKVPAANAYALPDELDFRQGALIEPLSCAVRGMHRIEIQPGESALVVGAGTMGLLLQQLILRAGAKRVAVVDTNEGKLGLAEKLGADAVATSTEELGDFDVAVDATGAPPAIESAFDALRRGGRLMIFGVAHGDARVSLSPFRIYNDEITVLGSMAVLHSYGPAVDLMAAGAIDTGSMLTHDFPLESFGDALETVRRGEGVKSQVLPGGPEAAGSNG
jgi:2-desacetyl-2-hydroxyethyl bacteriochlorophyllide A dehydrogenase